MSLAAQAQVNGTLNRIAHHAVALCRGITGVIPMMFFAVTALLSSIGPGHIARALFNKLLAWDLSMTVVGALVCWVFFSLL